MSETDAYDDGLIPASYSTEYDEYAVFFADGLSDKFLDEAEAHEWLGRHPDGELRRRHVVRSIEIGNWRAV